MVTLAVPLGPDQPDPPEAPHPVLHGEQAVPPSPAAVPSDLAELTEAARNVLNTTEAMCHRLRLLLARIDREGRRQAILAASAAHTAELLGDELAATMARHPAGRIRTRTDRQPAIR